ncbi:MAG: hypothetical protein F6J93_34775 [Oscillatoria sp. SIO1A7]|nr:hypothetical protein [Oscillatoria sp. SIO1A7]
MSFIPLTPISFPMSYFFFFHPLFYSYDDRQPTSVIIFSTFPPNPILHLFLRIMPLSHALYGFHALPNFISRHRIQACPENLGKISYTNLEVGPL